MPQKLVEKLNCEYIRLPKSSGWAPEDNIPEITAIFIIDDALENPEPTPILAPL